MLAHLAASLVQPVISSVGVRRTGRKYLDKNYFNYFNANYFNYELKLKGVFLRNNSSKLKDGACVINLNDKKK